MIHQAPLEAGAEWAYSSVVEHCVDIAGVASSILATPTIFSFAMSFSKIVILFPAGTNGTGLMLWFKECFGLIVVTKERR